MQIHIAYSFLPKKQTVKAVELQQTFGIDFDQGEHILVDQLELNIKPGEIVLLTGDSGSGKSSILREIASKLMQDQPQASQVVNISDLEFDDRILIEQLGLPLNEGLSLLSQCGLSEARLLLRTPRELSEGQRYRFLLALAISQKPHWIIADEFCANLDRTLAKVLAFNLNKLSQHHKLGFILATTHEDLITDLAPGLHVKCRAGQQPQVVTVLSTASLNQGYHLDKPSQTVKKKSPSITNCGFPQVPNPIGRISLGGITAVTTSASPDSSPYSGIKNNA